MRRPSSGSSIMTSRMSRSGLNSSSFCHAVGAVGRACRPRSPRSRGPGDRPRRCPGRRQRSGSWAPHTPSVALFSVAPPTVRQSGQSRSSRGRCPGPPAGAGQGGHAQGKGRTVLATCSTGSSSSGLWLRPAFLTHFALLVQGVTSPQRRVSHTSDTTRWRGVSAGRWGRRGRRRPFAAGPRPMIAALVVGSCVAEADAEVWSRGRTLYTVVSRRKAGQHGGWTRGSGQLQHDSGARKAGMLPIVGMRGNDVGDS